MSNITFRNVIACDDIRQERNGKFMLIGMYAGSFLSPSFPIQVSLQFGIWAQVSESADHHCNFQISLEPGNAPPAGIEVKFEVMPGETEVFLPLPKFPLNIGAPGFLVVKETVSDQEIFRLKIAQAEVDGALVSP